MSQEGYHVVNSSSWLAALEMSFERGAYDSMHVTLCCQPSTD